MLGVAKVTVSRIHDALNKLATDSEVHYDIKDKLDKEFMCKINTFLKRKQY